jgi:hypothetical protein
MTGAEAIALATRRGVTLEVFLGNLRVYSQGEPDESLVRLLRDNKQAVTDAILAAETEPDRWRRVLAEKIETIMQLRGLPRPDAEREAFKHVVIESFELDAPENRSEPLRPLRRLRDARRFSLAIRDARSPLHLVARESVLGGLAGSAGARPRSKQSLQWASPRRAVAADDVAIAGGCAIAKRWRTLLDM